MDSTYVKKQDAAVSPVIAVILMVAITIVLAAVVYVWVSGFGSSAQPGAAETVGISSAGAYDATAFLKPYSVTSASPSLVYGDVRVVVGGETLTASATDADCGSAYASLGPGEWVACASSTAARAAGDAVSAGDLIVIRCAADCEGALLVLVDEEANAVMTSVTVR